MLLILRASDLKAHLGKKLPTARKIVRPVIEAQGTPGRRVAFPLRHLTRAEKRWLRWFLEDRAIPYVVRRWYPKDWKHENLLRD